MKPQDSVSSVAGAVKLPLSVTTFLQHTKEESEDDSIINGGVLRNTRFAWLSSGSKFIVINILTGHKIAAWTFGAVLRDFRTKVTCVYELPSPLLDHTMQLLVGLECDLIGGMVCLFHCQGSRVLRAVQVDCRVSCLQYVDRFPEGPLQCFDGVVVIGTQGGNTLAFDLGRQSCMEAILHANNGQDNLIKDELNIANLVVLSIDDIDIIHEQRAIACEKKDHIAIQINEGCFHNLQYILHNPDNTIGLRATRERVFVTNMLYVPQLASIVIGFNFGAFQLWNLVSLKLEFTSPANADGLPISHFGYQEPCDDPRAFSYLWVVYSSLDRHEEGFPLATMYALTYEGKTALNGGGYLYENFITCHLRFNIELTSIDTSNTTLKQMVGGRSLSCHTFNKSAGKPEDCDECVLNLCQIVWECWTMSAIAPVQSMMIVFDIDQWYKEQMPDCTVLETNSYLSVVNLGDTLSHTASSYLCDVRINAETLTPYYSVPRLEEHFYPNSLGYECFCLTNTDITRLSTMGVQRQMLSSINEIGPSLLLNPTKLFQQCIACGLLPLYVEPMPILSTPVAIQRQTILSIALEARLLQFLVACACDWATGSHSSVGCSLAVLTCWAWARALCLKTAADQLTVPLFDHSGDMPDGNSARCLESCTRQLGCIASLLGIVANKCSPLMPPEALKKIKLQQKSVHVVSLYYQVVQWFLNVGLLPEFNMDHQLHLLQDNNERLPYPVDSLVRYYQNRRYKLHCLNGENPTVENLQDKSCPLLFIDQFIKKECCEEKLKMFWMNDGSQTQGLYPPPSLHSLLRIYLIPEIKEEFKHYLVLYVLVDYATTFDDSRYENIIRRLMQFPTMFGFSNTGLKITEAFWHLDHRDFDFALVQLQSLLASGCLKQWQHNVVLASLLAQKKTQSALQYLHVRNPYASTTAEGAQDVEPVVSDDWEACCNLYLSRGLVLEAFNLIKESFTEFDSADVRAQRMLTFLEGCRKMGILSKALLLPLSEDEEEILTKFLKALGDTESNNLLVMYYLQRSRYIEAQQVNEDLKHLTSKGHLPYDVTRDFSMKEDHVPKTKTRNELVDLYCKTLPRITRYLAQLASGNTLGRKMLMPTPMTVSLQAVIPKPAEYKSSIIQATINKANETWIERPTVARGLKRALQVEDTPFICTPKMARHHSRLAPLEKMITTPEESFKGSPPKRPRLETEDDSQSDRDDLQDPRLKKEVETLLHTPIVERKSHWRCGSRASLRSSMDRTPIREATPQSILKVRKLLEGGCSSVDERHFVETDDELETASQHTQSDNLSRSIRFNIPSLGNTPSPSVSPLELNDNFNELSEGNAYEQSPFSSRSVGLKISPRKAIHTSPDLGVPVSTPVKRTPPRGRKLISESNSSVSSLNNSVSDDSGLTPVKSKNVSRSIVSQIDTDKTANSPLEVQTDDDCESNASFSENTLNAEEAANTSYSQGHSQSIKYSNVKTEKASDDKPCNVPVDDSILEMHQESEPTSSISTSFLSEQVRKGPQPRRSLRKTPDKSIGSLVQSPSSRRSLRSRSRTPEPDSPGKTRHSIAKRTPTQNKAKKSLARMVLEANILSKTAEILDSPTVTKEEFISHCAATLPDVSQAQEFSDLSVDKASNYSESTFSQNDSILGGNVSQHSHPAKELVRIESDNLMSVSKSDDLSSFDKIITMSTSKTEDSEIILKFLKNVSQTSIPGEGPEVGSPSSRNVESDQFGPRASVSNSFNISNLKTTTMATRNTESLQFLKNSSKFAELTQNDSLLASDVSDAESDVSCQEPVFTKTFFTNVDVQIEPSEHNVDSFHLGPTSTSISQDVSRTCDKQTSESTVITETRVHISKTWIETSNAQIIMDSSNEDTQENASLDANIVEIKKGESISANELNSDGSNSVNLVIDTECERNDTDEEINRKVDLKLGENDDGSLLHSDVSDEESESEIVEKRFNEDKSSSEAHSHEHLNQQTLQIIENQDSKETKSTVSEKISDDNNEKMDEDATSEGSNVELDDDSVQSHTASESNDVELCEKNSDSASQSVNFCKESVSSDEDDSSSASPNQIDNENIDTDSVSVSNDCEKNIIPTNSESESNDVDLNKENESAGSSSENDVEFDEENDASDKDEKDSDNDVMEEDNSDDENSDSSESGDNLYIEESSSEDPANRAYLGDASEVISIISSDDSESKSETLEIVDENMDEAVQTITGTKNDLPEDEKELLPQETKNITEVSELKVVDDLVHDVINEATPNNAIEKETNKELIEDDTTVNVIHSVALVDEPASKNELSDKNPHLGEIISDPLDVTSNDGVDKLTKTLTQEELNNMSLMTEDSSVFEDAPVSLKYSDDENDSNQGKTNNNGDSNTDSNKVEISSDIQTECSHANSVNSDKHKDIITDINIVDIAEGKSSSEDKLKETVQEERKKVEQEKLAKLNITQHVSTEEIEPENSKIRSISSQISQKDDGEGQSKTNANKIDLVSDSQTVDKAEVKKGKSVEVKPASHQKSPEKDVQKKSSPDSSQISQNEDGVKQIKNDASTTNLVSVTQIQVEETNQKSVEVEQEKLAEPNIIRQKSPEKNIQKKFESSSVSSQSQNEDGEKQVKNSTNKINLFSDSQSVAESGSIDNEQHGDNSKRQTKVDEASNITGNTTSEDKVKEIEKGEKKTFVVEHAKPTESNLELNITKHSSPDKVPQNRHRRRSSVNSQASQKEDDKHLTEPGNDDLDTSIANSTRSAAKRSLVNSQASQKEGDDKHLTESGNDDLDTSIANSTRSATKRSLVNSQASQKENDDEHLAESANDDLDTSIANSTRSATKRKSESSNRQSRKDAEDDNASVVSNVSSRRSRRSDSKLDISFCSDLPGDEEETSAPNLRKSRRSILVLAKPNLSIIPELSHIESEKSQLDRTGSAHQSTSIMEYSASRRLTRHQRSMMEKSLESTPSTHPTKSKQRRSSTQSSEGTIYEEDTDSEVSEKADHDNKTLRKNITGKTMDPIKLLDKEDFKGQPDLEEMNNLETASVSSMASSVTLDFPQTARAKRASSEIAVKEIRRTRRSSLDIAGSPVKPGTPTSILDESITDSGGRPRRQSFNKAVEALSTPRRRRRLSTDSKNEGDGASFSDTGSDRGTPTAFKESRLSDANQSKLLVIEEDEVGEAKGEASATKPIRRGKKAASIHGYMVSPDMDNAEVRKARRMSQLLTPLSKEEQLNVEDTRTRFRRRTGTNKIIEQLQFTIKKK